MKLPRIFVLVLALGVVPALSLQAFGQQEIDPDHFDQPAVAGNYAHSVTLSDHQAKATGHHHKSVKMASRHSHSRHHRDMHAAA